MTYPTHKIDDEHTITHEPDWDRWQTWFMNRDRQDCTVGSDRVGQVMIRTEFTGVPYVDSKGNEFLFQTSVRDNSDPDAPPVYYHTESWDIAKQIHDSEVAEQRVGQGLYFDEGGIVIAIEEIIDGYQVNITGGPYDGTSVECATALDATGNFDYYVRMSKRAIAEQQRNQRNGV